MRPLTTRELFAVWDQAHKETPVWRALWLLATASPDESWEAIEHLSLVERDKRLLDLRECMFGSNMVCLAHCPDCKKELEVAFRVDDIRMPLTGQTQFDVVMDDITVTFRLPTSHDILLLLNPSRDVTQDRLLLLERCIIHIESTNGPHSVADLPAGLVDQILQKMEQAGQQADLRITLNCAECGHRWINLFDVVSFFWEEIDVWAKRLAWDIHILAKSYGWSEAEILSLSPNRRKSYRDLIQS